jgi:AAA domain, putative AbiEii toxin, Type IV TA system
VIEAIRLVSLVTNRLGGLNFEPAPDWLIDAGESGWGVSPSLRGFEFRLARHIFHRYAEPPAVIEAVFEAGYSITVYVGPDEDVFAVVRGPDSEPVVSRKDVRGWNLPRVGVQPQVGPVEDTELLLKERTVRQGLDSSLSPRHFRNQLVFMPDLFEEFCSLAQETWPGLQIREFNWEQAGEGKGLELMVRVDDFVGEVALMGHGLQMWLQLMWFLVRARDDHVVVLDEPDVFMHPDLQRRLIRFLRRRNQQVVIATHSVEMLSDVDPDEVVGLTPQKGLGRRSRSLRDLQLIVEEIGGVHNLSIGPASAEPSVPICRGQRHGPSRPDPRVRVPRELGSA